MIKTDKLFKSSLEKARADEKMDVAEKLIKRTWSIVNRCRKLLNGDKENLRRIRAIIFQGELFAHNSQVEKASRYKKMNKKCLESLTETF